MTACPAAAADDCGGGAAVAPAVAAAAEASAAEASAAADGDVPSEKIQERSVVAEESVPRGPLPASALVLAEALDASFCPVINELAQQLVQQLLLLHEEHPCLLEAVEDSPGGPPGAPSGGPSFSLELEGRLGVLLDRDKSTRLRLPLASHAVLQPSFCMGEGGGIESGVEEGRPHARFAAGVSSSHFTELTELLLKFARDNSKAASHRMQVNLALMGIEPSSGTQEDCFDPQEVQETAHGPNDEGPRKKRKTFDGEALVQISGDDWQVLPEVETEENYYNIPALQASARFSTKMAEIGGPPGGRRGPRPQRGAVAFLGGPVSIQGLSQVLVSPGIYKKNLLQWNVYTGADKEDAFASTDDWGPPSGGPDEAAERTRVDYRLAINFEHKIEVKDLQQSLIKASCTARGGPAPVPGYPGAPPPPPSANNADPQLRRRRVRQSLVHRSGLRVDLTKVQQQNRPTWGTHQDGRREPTGRWQYEVELELHPKQIAKAILHQQKTGDPRPLWCLCSTFLSLLRELAGCLNSPQRVNGADASKGDLGGNETELADLGPVQMTATEEIAFRHFMSEKLPLIGDYSYRAVAHEMEEITRQGTEQVLSLEEFLRQPDAQKKCLYTNNKTDISGPWIPHRDREGNVHLVEVRRKEAAN